MWNNVIKYLLVDDMVGWICKLFEAGLIASAGTKLL